VSASPNIVEKFLEWAEFDRLRSPHTVTRYRATLASLSTIADPATATTLDIDRWWVVRRSIINRDGSTRPRSAASRSNELACLRSFYRYMTRRDLRADDPTRTIDFLKPDNHVPRPMGESDLLRLLGPLTESAPDLRRAIALGVYGGLRVSEAAELDWSNVDFEARRMYVRGKGKKERAIGLHPILVDKLLPATGGNVVTAGGAPYSGASLQRKINRLIERSDISHTFHDLRKRGATLALARGVSPETVRQVYGWESMQTVTHYALVSSDELDKMAEAMI